MNTAQDMTTPISNEQVAVLAERVETLIQSHSRLEGILMGISTTQAVHTQRLGEGDRSIQTVFTKLDTLRIDHDKIAKDVNTHSFTWKLVGSFAMVSLGLVGYAFGELRDLQRAGSEREKRIAVLEYVVGTRPQPPKMQDHQSKGQ